MNFKSAFKTNYRFFILFFFIVVMYCAFPSKQYPYDGIQYAIDVQSHSSLFHPHHILYSFFIHQIYIFVTKIIQNISVMDLMLSINIIFGLGTIIITYFILFKLLKDNFYAFLCTSLFAFSYGIWFYSTTLEVYIIPIFCIVASIYVIIGKEISNKLLFMVGILSSLSILFHQSHIFILPVLSSLIFIQSKKTHKVKNVLLFSSISLLVVGVVYLSIAYKLGELSSFHKLWRWMTAYAQTDLWGQKIQFKNFILTGIGLIRNICFISGMIRENLLSILTYLLFFLISGVFLFINVVSMRKHRKEFMKYLYIVIPSFIWIILYICFSFWWEPGNIEFLMPILIPILLLLVLVLKISRIRKKINIVCLLLISLFLFLSNFLFKIYPDSKIENNLMYSIAKVIQSKTDKDSLIITGNDTWLVYLKYFWDEDRQSVYGLLRCSADSLIADKNQYLMDLEEKIKLGLSNHQRVITLDYSEPSGFVKEMFSKRLSKKEIEEFYRKFKMKKIEVLNCRNHKLPIIELLLQ